jgi:hypothetical protein
MEEKEEEHLPFLFDYLSVCLFRYIERVFIPLYDDTTHKYKKCSSATVERTEEGQRLLHVHTYTHTVQFDFATRSVLLFPSLNSLDLTLVALLTYLPSL